MADFTKLLNDSVASRDEKVFGELYEELRRIARGRMAGERKGHTLDTNALVHEAWLRLEGSSPEQWRDRLQFYAAATEAMRRILVESARRRLTAKRGSGEVPVPLEEVELSATLPDEHLLAVHDALDLLEEENEMEAHIVKLRFFSGLNNHEIAALLELNEKTIRRHWTLAKVWLYRVLSEESLE